MKKIYGSILLAFIAQSLNAQSNGVVDIQFANDRDTTINSVAQRVFDVQAKAGTGYVINDNYPDEDGYQYNDNGSFTSIGIVFTHTLNGAVNMSNSDYTLYSSGYILSPGTGSHPGSYPSQYGTGTAAKFEITRDYPRVDLTSEYKTVAKIAYPLSGAGTTITLVDNTVAPNVSGNNASGYPVSFWTTSSNGGAGYYLMVSGNNSIVLPINYKYFTAEPKDNNAILNWETATETNNAYFDVQRSFDGANFVKIGQVKGSGTTSAPVDYTYTDLNPQANLVYYRLNQVDVDGHAHLSEIKRVQFTNIEHNTPTLVYPNPSNTGIVNVTFGNNTHKVIFWDVLGRKVTELTQSGTVNLSTGSYIAQSLNQDGSTFTNRVAIISQQ